MNNPPLVIITEPLDPRAASWLATRARVHRVDETCEAWFTTLQEADALIVRTRTSVSPELLAHAPNLKVVGRAGVGLDHINISACRARSIEVVYTPDANTQAVVEYVIALMCDALRPRPALDHAVDERTWMGLRDGAVGERQLDELTVGILGLGRIGKRLARTLTALGCDVGYHDLLKIAPARRFGAAPVALRDLFQRSDAISIHVDGRASNRGFVDDSLLKRMRDNVLLLNTSRGFVVDNMALATFLRTHPRARAYLDVHEPEPFGPEYPLLGLANATLFPHLASRTARALRAMSLVVHDVVRVLEGEPPENPAPG